MDVRRAGSRRGNTWSVGEPSALDVLPYTTGGPCTQVKTKHNQFKKAIRSVCRGSPFEVRDAAEPTAPQAVLPGVAQRVCGVLCRRTWCSLQRVCL